MKAPTNNLCRAVTFERTAADDDGLTLEGYAAVFGEPTRIDSWEGTFDEVIERGAFQKTLGERMPVMQFDHGKDIATGSVPIGAIELIREDDRGLFVRARLHDNARVEPIRQAIASGAIDGMSFRFRVTRESWNKDETVPQRTIREADLFELGPVVFPAYEATSVGVRSLLTDLDADQRAHLVRDLAAEIATASAPESPVERTDPSDAGQQATSDIAIPDAAPQGTSVDQSLAARQQMARRIEAEGLGITPS
jgi:HK97 family phage prohead protease